MTGIAHPRAALCVVHGIGAQRKDWAERFVANVRRAVAARDPAIDVYPLVVWWAPVTQRDEDQLIARYRRGLSWTWLRRLVIGFGGDVIAYLPPTRIGTPLPYTYQAVQRRIDRRLRGLRGLIEQTTARYESPVPLVVVAHSLGSVIFTDFVSDLERSEPPPAFARRYGLRLRALYTAGSPLALYALRYPHLRVDRRIIVDGAWVNVLYSADLIAYPLGPVNPADATPVTDWTLPARLWDWSWTPRAHLAYWGDPRFIGNVADTLVRVAEDA